MENNKSLLVADRIDIKKNLYVCNPTVGEVLQDEKSYYSLVTAITASPMQFMVQLDDMGIDYTQISDYELFILIFPVYARTVDTTNVFGDLDLSDASVEQVDDGSLFIYCQKEEIVIDVPAYIDLSDALRKINLLTKDKTKPGNESARKYLLEKERKRLKRLARKPYKPYLEKLVVSLVNTSEFPYDYSSCMDLSLYSFNQSVKQIQRKINFDNVMNGVYSGTVDTKKMGDKDSLSWIPTH